MDEEKIRQSLEFVVGEDNFENIDEEILSYICAVMEDKSIEEDEVIETVGPLLAGSGCLEDEDDEEEAESKSRAFLDKYKELTGGSDTSNNNNNAQLLDAPINIAEKTKTDIYEAKTKFELNDGDNKLYDEEEVEKIKKKHEERKKKRAEKEEKKKLEQLEKNFGEANKAVFVRKKEGSSGSRDIRCDGICIANGKDRLLINATLVLAFGRRYGLVGRNGCGKTTLLRHLASREIFIPESISILHVEQEIEGDDTSALDSVIAADSELVGLWEEEKNLLENDPENLRLHQIYLRLEELEAETAEARASAILSGLSFTEEMKEQATKDFSGGWRMRIALARSLFCKPDLLLLDEPTNHLDFHAVVWLEKFLSEWDSTLLVVSHQREFLNNVCSDILHLTQQDLIAYKGNYDNFEKVASERLRQHKKEYEASQNQRQHIQRFIDRFRANAKRAKMAQSRIKKLERMKEVSPIVEEGAVNLPFLSPSVLVPPILQFEDISFGYPGSSEPLFSDINLGVDLDSRIALVGRNGSGKSTLLKLMSEEILPTSGNIYKNNKLRFGIFSQHFVDQLDLNLSPLEYFKKYVDSTQTNQVLRSHLGKYGLSGDLALRSMRALSGGQKSRVVFAKIAWSRPHILLLDEPSNHLDIETIEGLSESLNVFEGGVLMVSHDQRLISMVCDNIWLLENQSITVWEGDVDDYKKYLEQEAFEHFYH